MLTSDLSRKANAIFGIIFMYAIYFFLHTDVKSSSILRKIEVNIKSNSHFGVSIDVFLTISMQ